MAALTEEDHTIVKNNYFRQVIEPLIRATFNINELSNLQTTNGNTQVSERNIINNIREAFNNNNICFEEAGTQQPYDFRNVGPNNSYLSLDYLEIKKTNGNIIYLNDTIPTAGVKYIVFVTSRKNPRILFLDGSDLLNGSESWIYEYQNDINNLKDTFCRGKNASNLPGIMQVYARPTYKADISSFT